MTEYQSKTNWSSLLYHLQENIWRAPFGPRGQMRTRKALKHRFPPGTGTAGCYPPGQCKVPCWGCPCWATALPSSRDHEEQECSNRNNRCCSIPTANRLGGKITFWNSWQRVCPWNCCTIRFPELKEWMTSDGKEVRGFFCEEALLSEPNISELCKHGSRLRKWEVLKCGKNLIQFLCQYI